MALSLDATLLAAQTSSSRHPICEITIEGQDLTEYLTGETTLEWKLDGEPAASSFTMSHGHLFDRANITSPLCGFLKKGNHVTFRIGEIVDGTKYWANQGTFVIQESKLNHERGEYPIVTVRCADRRYTWDQHIVAAAQVNQELPEDAIKSIILENYSLTDENFSSPAFTDEDFNLPTFEGGFAFDANWVDTSLQDIINDIGNRFGYFLFMSSDNKVTARKIDTAAAVSNECTSSDQIIRYVPNCTDSDFVNRITVTGQSLDEIEVTYSEERLAQLSGTIGWWGCKNDYVVYYSTDMSRRAKSPRLVVLEAASSIMFQLAGSVSERISYVDPANKYCIVTIKVPNLLPVLLSGVALWSASFAVPDMVVTGGKYVQFGVTIPVGRILEGVGGMLVMQVLGSFANYQFEIYGRPLGYVKRTYSGTANDTDLQNEIGYVIENKYDGFLCHLPAHCQDVANLELAIAMAQRNQVSITKIAHLQDEVGDIISVPHPYSGAAVKMLIASLTRRYKPANRTEEGYFIDEIEGWVV